MDTISGKSLPWRVMRFYVDQQYRQPIFQSQQLDGLHMLTQCMLATCFSSSNHSDEWLYWMASFHTFCCSVLKLQVNGMQRCVWGCRLDRELNEGPRVDILWSAGLLVCRTLWVCESRLPVDQARTVWVGHQPYQHHHSTMLCRHTLPHCHSAPFIPTENTGLEVINNQDSEAINTKFMLYMCILRVESKYLA